MVIEYAADYIAMGEDLEMKRSYLNSACSAWNISNLTPEDRGAAMQQYLDNFRELNPHVQEVNDLKEDIERLIDRKVQMFPDVKKEIVGAEISEIDGKEHIHIASMPHRRQSSRSR